MVRKPQSSTELRRQSSSTRTFSGQMSPCCSEVTTSCRASRKALQAERRSSTPSTCERRGRPNPRRGPRATAARASTSSARWSSRSATQQAVPAPRRLLSTERVQRAQQFDQHLLGAHVEYPVDGSWKSPMLRPRSHGCRCGHGRRAVRTARASPGRRMGDHVRSVPRAVGPGARGRPGSGTVRRFSRRGRRRRPPCLPRASAHQGGRGPATGRAPGRACPSAAPRSSRPVLFDVVFRGTSGPVLAHPLHVPLLTDEDETPRSKSSRIVSRSCPVETKSLTTSPPSNQSPPSRYRAADQTATTGARPCTSTRCRPGSTGPRDVRRRAAAGHRGPGTPRPARRAGASSAPGLPGHQPMVSGAAPHPVGNCLRCAARARNRRLVSHRNARRATNSTGRRNTAGAPVKVSV